MCEERQKFKLIRSYLNIFDPSMKRNVFSKSKPLSFSFFKLSAFSIDQLMTESVALISSQNVLSCWILISPSEILSTKWNFSAFDFLIEVAAAKGKLFDIQFLFSVITPNEYGIKIKMNVCDKVNIIAAFETKTCDF